MIKTAAALLLLATGSLAYAQDSTTLISDSFKQIRNEEAETRNKVNDHTKALEALNKKVTENSATSTAKAPDEIAPDVPVPSKSSGKIDYTKYDRIVRDCVGAWNPSPERKDELAKRWNALSKDNFEKLDEKCLALSQQAARSREQQAVMVPPPAPEAIPDNGQVPAETADLRDDRDAMPAPQPVMYPGYYQRGYSYHRYHREYHYGRGYGRGRGHCPPTFHYDASAGACARYSETPYGSKMYDDPNAHCTPGAHRSFMTQGPYGPRKVFQVCRPHHY